MKTDLCDYESILNKNMGKRPKLLLHSCCAPCSSYCLVYMRKWFDITCFYYNPNITDEEEYNKRRDELIRLADALNNDPVYVKDGELVYPSIGSDAKSGEIYFEQGGKGVKKLLTQENSAHFIGETADSGCFGCGDGGNSFACERADHTHIACEGAGHSLDACESGMRGYSPIKVISAEFEPSLFLDAVKKSQLASCPERGERCTMCFNMRLKKTRDAALQGGFSYFTSTLTLSPLKNAKLINKIGAGLAENITAGGLSSKACEKGMYYDCALNGLREGAAVKGTGDGGDINDGTDVRCKGDGGTGKDGVVVKCTGDGGAENDGMVVKCTGDGSAEKDVCAKWLYSDFKKKNGYKMSIELSKRYGLYRQNYCGCIYSKR